MDVNEYIASGLLELYALGRLSAREAAGVAASAAAYPEIAAEIDRIEGMLEELAFRTAGNVDPEVLERTLQRIRDQRSGSPAPPAATPPATSGLLPWLLAFAALAIACGLWFSGRGTGAELAAASADLAATRTALTQLEAACDSVAAQTTLSGQVFAALARPATRTVPLAGTDNAPDKSAVVFYDADKEAAFFAASNLPTPPAGKQYQLWGIDGDGPKSLGVLDPDLAAGTLLNLDFLPGVAAFAITLEDEGGKDTPDLSQLQVIGEV